MFEYQMLYCRECAMADQKIDDFTLIRGKCDVIGWLVPAVPTEDGQTFWGYSSVPEGGVECWWRI